jgi:23S rRNA (adenine2503-C2)-methyltransferase
MALQVIHQQGDDRIARVHVARLDDGTCIEMVESLQPPRWREDKWVLIVSTLKGCPVRCPICDAGGSFSGGLSRDEILGQIDFMVDRHYPDRWIPCRHFKIQFARMGDPAFNDAVLDVLEELPVRYDAPGLMPCISTVAPAGRNRFFDRLLELRTRLYPERFQMQFSLHTTDPEVRNRLIPARTWTFRQMADYGTKFHGRGGRKVALNFAVARGVPLDAAVLAETFSPDVFAVKLTPINPTAAAVSSGLTGLIDPARPQDADAVAAPFRDQGYEVIVSIGENEENRIGSNCGMFVSQPAVSNGRAESTVGIAQVAAGLDGQSSGNGARAC